MHIKDAGYFKIAGKQESEFVKHRKLTGSVDRAAVHGSNRRRKNTKNKADARGCSLCNFRMHINKCANVSTNNYCTNNISI
jgi:hypothetical protein